MIEDLDIMKPNNGRSGRKGFLFLVIFNLVIIVLIFSTNNLNYSYWPTRGKLLLLKNTRTNNLTHKNYSVAVSTVKTTVRHVDRTVSIANWRQYTEANVKKVKNMFPEGTPHILTVNSSYVIPNSELCSNVSDLTYIVLIHTAPRHFERRRSLRHSWANHTFFVNLKSRTVFLLGTVLDEKLNNRIRNESEEFGDIVQGNFTDSYRNLTLKNVMGIRWVTENCQNAKYIIKADDDTFVNMHVVFKYLFPLLFANNKLLICRVVINSPIVRPGGIAKWAVANNYFINQTAYPAPNCLGFFVVFSVPLAVELFEQAKSLPYFFIDDVYVYGIIASKVKGITWKNVQQGIQLQRKGVMDAMKYRLLIAGSAGNDKDMQTLFTEINQQNQKE